jgi:hypothetical protein
MLLFREQFMNYLFNVTRRSKPERIIALSKVSKACMTVLSKLKACRACFTYFTLLTLFSKLKHAIPPRSAKHTQACHTLAKLNPSASIPTQACHTLAKLNPSASIDLSTPKHVICQNKKKIQKKR